MTQIIIIATGIGLLLLVLLFFISRQKRNTKPIDRTTTLHERMFTPVLEKVVGEQNLVLPKIALSEILEPIPELSDRAQNKALKKVEGRLFDFVITDRITGRVICAVELDEHQFDKKTFKTQDLYLENLCSEIGLPLLRVPSQRGYNLSELIERFERITEPSVVDAEYASANQLGLQLKPISPSV